MKLYQKILLCVDKAYRIDVIVIYAMMIMLAGIETLCAILFLPFLKVIEDAGSVQDYGWLVKGMEWFGKDSHIAAIVMCCSVLLIAYLFKNTFTLFYKYKQTKLVRELQAKLATKLLAKYLKSTYITHLSRNSADMIRNINQDTISIFSNVIRSLLTASVEAIIALGLFGLLLYQNVVTTLLASVVFGVLGTLIYRTSQRYTYAYGQSARHGMSQMIQWTIQGVSSIKETKVMHKEDYFLSRYEGSVKVFTDASIKYGVLSEVPRLSIEVLGILVVLLMTVVLLSQSSPEEALPTLGLFAVASFRLLPSLTRITSSLALVRFYLSALDNVVEDLTGIDTDTAYEAHQGKATREDALTFGSEAVFEDVSFSYNKDDGQRVIDNCSLRIGKGQSVAFVGSSGAGKTTLIDLLLGLLTPDSGQIVVDGDPISHDLQGWQRQIGYISQPVYMLNDTVKRNVAFGVHDEQIDEARVWRALEQAQLKGVIEELPDGIDHDIGESGVKLSGGQRQRVGIARVLYHDPEILVFDEATSALDNETEAEITRAIDALSKQKTLVLIAHRFSTIEKCDVIFVLEQGRVLSQGSYEELLATCSTFQRLALASGAS